MRDDHIVRRRGFVKRVTGVMVAGLLAGGCASIGAVQEPITAADLDQHICPKKAELSHNPADPAQRGAYRDDIILACVKAINRRYAEFKLRLHQESTGANLFTDLVSQTLATAASVDSGGTAKGLAASSALITGSGKAINKNVFFDIALPALEASMDAKRDRILTSITDSQQGDATAATYTLARAGYDLDAYEAAGSLYAALADLTQAASQDATDAREDLVASQQGRIASVTVSDLLTEDVRIRIKALTDKVLALKAPAGTATLDRLVTLLSVKTQADDTFETKKANVLVAIVNAVSVNNEAKRLANISALEAKLAPVLR